MREARACRRWPSGCDGWQGCGSMCGWWAPWPIVLFCSQPPSLASHTRYSCGAPFSWPYHAHCKLILSVEKGWGRVLAEELACPLTPGWERWLWLASTLEVTWHAQPRSGALRSEYVHLRTLALHQGPGPSAPSPLGMLVSWAWPELGLGQWRLSQDPLTPPRREVHVCTVPLLNLFLWLVCVYGRTWSSSQDWQPVLVWLCPRPASPECVLSSWASLSSSLEWREDGNIWAPPAPPPNPCSKMIWTGGDICADLLGTVFLLKYLGSVLQLGLCRAQAIGPFSSAAQPCPTLC